MPGRDRLLRRLALMRRDDPHVKFVLAALEGHPIRDGAELIGEIAQCGELADEVRSQAARAMATVADKAVAVRSAAMLGTEPGREVSNALLDMAVQRRLAVPMKGLRQRIEMCRDRVELHQLLKRFVQVMPHAPTAEWEIAAESLHSWIKKALRTNGDGAESANELAKALTMALPCAGTLDRRCIREDTFNLARNCLAQFARAPEQEPEGRVLLSVAVVDHFHNADARVDLREALDAALHLVEEPNSNDKRRDRMASAIANCLARLAPGELLDYPFDCGPVQWTLRLAALERGWMVYVDRILDAEGNLVATASRSGTASAAPRTPAELTDLVKRLSSALRAALESYWLMVGPDGPCDYDTSLKKIHDAMRDCMNDSTRNDITDSLANIFEDGLPEFGTWQKNLNRIREEFEDDPEMLALLKRMGLCRRWKPRGR